MKTKISLVLTAVLLLLVFAGCQRSSTTDQTGNSRSTGNTSQQTDTRTPSTNAANAPSTDDTSATTASAATVITLEEAKSIALQHAGFTADQVTRLYAEQDLDDYIPHYDVEFHKDNYEYDYEINAQTGEILKSEREWD